MNYNAGHKTKSCRCNTEIPYRTWAFARKAEILGFDSRTILNIENGRGNPKFEKLYPLVRHLNISADRIFYPESVTPQPNLQKLFIMLNDCTEQEVAELLPAVHYLLALMRKRDNSEQ